MFKNYITNIKDFCNNLLTESVIGHFLKGAEFNVGFVDSVVGIPIKILSKPKQGIYGSILVIVFHGAINQKERKIPVFYSGDQIAKHFGENVTVLSIADPSLRLHSDLISTWYAGDYEINTQKILCELFVSMESIINPSKFLFVGGSTGAHPALLHSHNIKNSICLVTNPLPDIEGYYRKFVDFYKDICWPKTEYENLYDNFKDNIAETYRSGHDNTVFILQNSTDHHLSKQVLPLVCSITNNKKMLFVCEFFSDCIGHNYPTKNWLNWVSAIIGDNSNEIFTIAEIASSSNSIIKKNSSNKQEFNAINERDIFIAKRLSVELM